MARDLEAIWVKWRRPESRPSGSGARGLLREYVGGRWGGDLELLGPGRPVLGRQGGRAAQSDPAAGPGHHDLLRCGRGRAGKGRSPCTPLPMSLISYFADETVEAQRG